jgi:hypothetical protein
MRTNQLVLIETQANADFSIDDRTRDLGLKGIAAARKALLEVSQKRAA